MVTKIQKNDLEKYIKQYENIYNINDINNDILFEGLSEVIVDKNEQYECEKLMEEYIKNNDINNENELHKFVESKFDDVLSHKVKYIISIAHKNKWIEFTKEGMIEYYHKK